MKVKVISASFPTSLENDVNFWLKSNRVNVIDIKYAVDGSVSSMYRFSAMIVYD